MATAQKLYQDALTAEIIGDMDEARRLLLEAVTEDSEYLDAWLKLAEIMPDSDDKYDVLEQILQLDPDNAFAQQEWERLNIVFSAAQEEAEEAEEQAAKAERLKIDLPPAVRAAIEGDPGEEIVPGITQRDVRLVVLGLSIFTIFMCFCSFSVRGFVNNREDRTNQEATALALAPQQTFEANSANLTATAVVVNETATVVAATQALFITPPTVERVTGNLPTEIPDTPTPTPFVNRVFSAPPLDAGITGRILAYGGTNPRARDFLPLRSYNVADGENATRNLTEYPNIFVRNATTDVVRSRIIADVYDTREQIGLITELSGIDPTNELSVPGDAAAGNPMLPVLSVTGADMVYINEDQLGQQQVYLMTFAENILNSEIAQLTSGDFTYFSAGLSPTSRKVVAIRRDLEGIDLVEIDLESGAAPTFSQRELTGDGDVFIEGAPRYAPDGVHVVFTVAPDNDRNRRDVVLINTGTGERSVIADSPEDDTTPHFSPDRRYIVYSSNRTGVYNLFIYDRFSEITYQLTDHADFPVFAAGWSN